MATDLLEKTVFQRRSDLFEFFATLLFYLFIILLFLYLNHS